MIECTAERVEPVFGCGIAGVLKAAVGVKNMLPIVHGSVGCAAGHRIIPLFAGKIPLVPTTALTEIDVIMGSEKRLREAVEKGIELYQPELVVVILTCATSLTGEIQSAFAHSIEQKFGCACLVLDGSGISGDEIDAFVKFLHAYRALEAKNPVHDPAPPGIDLIGYSPADYCAASNLAALKKLLAEGFERSFSRVYFDELAVRENPPTGNPALSIGYAWTEDGHPLPAPVGAEGIRAWLERVTEICAQTPADSLLNRLKQLETEIRALREAGLNRLRVGIEAGSWSGIALANFLARELGCAVLLSSDRQACAYQHKHGITAQTLIDTGNIELVEHLIDFGADIVFGSSYMKRAEWAWVPFWQPVWHVVAEPSSFIGIEGTRQLLALLKNYQDSLRHG